jgi:hypothetical protein
MNMTVLGAARARRKAERAMETNADGTSFQEGNHVRIKRTGLTSDGASLWQMAEYPKRIRVIDPADGHVVREIGLGERAEGMSGLFVNGTSY